MAEFFFTAIAQLTMKHTPGEKGSKPVDSALHLDVSSNLDRKVYIDDETGITKAGHKPTTYTLIAGLVANIKLGHQQGWWDKEEHLKFVKEELDRMMEGSAEKPEIGVLKR